MVQADLAQAQVVESDGSVGLPRSRSSAVGTAVVVGPDGGAPAFGERRRVGAGQSTATVAAHAQRDHDEDRCPTGATAAAAGKYGGVGRDAKTISRPNHRYCGC